MATTSGSKWATSKSRQQHSYADLGVHRGSEDTIRLDFFLLLGPERIGEIVVESRVLRVNLLGSEEKLQTSTLMAMELASGIKYSN